MVSVARLVTTAAVAGGLLVGPVALGAGVASAAPAPAKVVPASCGQTVSAMPGDTVRIKPKIGTTEDYVVGGAPGKVRIPSSAARPMCEVDVNVKAAPAPAAAPMAAYPYGAYPMAPAAAPGAPVAPAAAPAAAPIPAAAPAAAPIPAAAPRAAAPAAAAPLPATGRSTSRSATGSAAAASVPADALAAAPAPDAGLAGLPGVAGLPLGAPAAPAAPAPAPAADGQVVPTGNSSALPPADSHGLGVPVLIALLAGAGVAAFGVRMLMLRRGSTAAHAATRHEDPFASDFDVDPAEETALVEPAEARTVVGSRA